MKLNHCLVIKYIYIVSPPTHTSQINLFTFFISCILQHDIKSYSQRHTSFDMQYREAKAL